MFYTSISVFQGSLYILLEVMHIDLSKIMHSEMSHCYYSTHLYQLILEERWALGC